MALRDAGEDATRAPRSWATARWRWAASAITTRRSPKPGRRSNWRPTAPPPPRAGLRALFRRPRVRCHRADRAGARDRSVLRAGAQDAGAGPGGCRQGRRRPSTCCSARCARIRSTATPSCSSPSSISSAERFAAGARDAGALPQGGARRCAGAQQPGPGAARPQALRRGAAGAQARLAACDRRSAGADQSRRACWSISAGQPKPARCTSMPCAACRAIRGCWPITASAWPPWASATGRARRSTTRWRPIPTMPRHWRHARASTHERRRRSPGRGQSAASPRRRRPRAGRPADVTLVAVSKTHGADRVRELLDAGQRVFGENRVQEARGEVSRP